MTNHTLQKQLIQSGAALAGTAVILGAFGAHQLKSMISKDALDAYETAVRYQFYHALAIILIGNMMRRLHEQTVKQVFQLFLSGIIIFSGSLYIVSTREITLGDSIKWVGGLTPIGGVGLIAGWALLAFRGYKENDGSDYRPRRSRSAKKEEEGIENNS